MQLNQAPHQINKLMKKRSISILVLCSIVTANLSAQSFSDQALSQQLREHVKILAADSMDGRGLGTEGKVLAKNYIAAHFESVGLKPIGADYFQHFKFRSGSAWIPATNVVGFLEGYDPVLKDDIIVIGAHYDHLGYELRKSERVVYPGADDNASGTATMMELARLFARDPAISKRTIVFIAFDAEESGLRGASAFLNENERFKPETIKLMFSLDMVGMYAANRGVDLRGAGSVEGGVGIAKTIAKKLNIRLLDTSAEIESMTDTWPFGQRGIPAIHVYTGMQSPYHKPQDTYDLLDYEGMARLTNYLQNLITELSALPALRFSRFIDSINKPAYFKFNSGAVLYLGSSHHEYPDEFFKAKGVLALGGGLFLQVHAGKELTLQPELLYTSWGSKAEKGTFRTHNLTVPVTFQWNLTNQGRGMFRFYPFLGPYFSYSFAGRYDKKSPDFNNIYRDQENGLQYGIGIDVRSLQMRFTSTYAFTNLYRSRKPEALNKGFYFVAGLKF